MAEWAKLEFAVEMSCGSCEQAVIDVLLDVPGVRMLEIAADQERLVLESTLPIEKLQDLIETSGRKAVLKGVGSSAGEHHGAAVTMLEGRGPECGVVRLMQVSSDCCLIEGTVDRLTPGLHGLHVHSLGDLTADWLSCGGHFNPRGGAHGEPTDENSHAGDLGNILADEHGSASFRMASNKIHVWNIIGRSVVVTEREDDLGKGNHELSLVTGNSGEGVAWGIIARSAGLFQNPKRICTCDGVTLWEEREKQIAGKGVQHKPATMLANL
uniref:copper chaperone for superoxide dismutase-like isoform X2 n=1 Tax=Myxine glutinosa TaxID=7769 RepID=UPI00358EC15E